MFKNLVLATGKTTLLINLLKITNEDTTSETIGTLVHKGTDTDGTLTFQLDINSPPSFVTHGEVTIGLYHRLLLLHNKVSIFNNGSHMGIFLHIEGPDIIDIVIAD